ncbi:O-antigen ligase family protein [Halorhodospira halophila]|uniref:O-antigen ligase family protein n=1 Tax=Halorhodospira halophila TaxID=1053 RepID=UPI001914B1D8|nr:O-antigen ligase family protein [Halorhodospira halophila]
MHADPRRLKWLVGMSLIGMLLYLLRDTDWQAVWSALAGEHPITRAAFSTNANRYATVIVVLLVALLTLGVHYGSGLAGGVKRASAGLLIALGFLFLWYVLILTESRQGIVGAAVVTAVCVALIPYLLAWERWWRYTLVSVVVGIAAGVAAIAIGYVLSDAIQERFDQVVEAAVALAALPDTATMELSGSPNKRSYILLKGVELVRESPILGIGPLDPAPFLDRFETVEFHNVFLDVLVSFGVVGLGFFLTPLVALIWHYRGAVVFCPKDKPFVVFCAVALLSFLVTMMFSARISSDLGRYMLLISLSVAGLSYYKSRIQACRKIK